MLCIVASKCRWRQVYQSRHYTELTVDLLTNGSKMPPVAHFIVQGHAKKREF